MKKNEIQLYETQLCNKKSVKRVLKEGAVVETPHNVIEILSRGPIKNYAVSADSDGLIYVEASTGDCNQLKKYMKTTGYSCVNDCTFVTNNGAPSGNRMLTFQHWGGFHNPLGNN